MDDLPDAIVQYILSHITDAKDVAYCNRVSKRWKVAICYLRRLYFPRTLFQKLKNGRTTDSIILQMVMSISRLEELIVYCPFSNVGLASWLMAQASSLRNLELRVDDLAGKKVCLDPPSKLECLKYASNLESLRLWAVLMVHSPKWDSFLKLKNLEIINARLEDLALSHALKACPNLTNLSLLGCRGLMSVSIELPKLEQCKLCFYGFDDCSLLLTSPKLESLELQGCNSIRVHETKCLRTLSIANNYGPVDIVDFGKLVSLEFLSIRGVELSWDTMSKILQLGREVKHLYTNVEEFLDDFEALIPFEEIDFVDFFNSHPKLQKFDIHGALFAALCQKNNLKNVDSSFEIPCLEEVVITVKSPKNAKLKMLTLKSLVEYGKNLKKMTIKISQMQGTRIQVNDFFERVCRFRSAYPKIISIE